MNQRFWSEQRFWVIQNTIHQGRWHPIPSKSAKVVGHIQHMGRPKQALTRKDRPPVSKSRPEIRPARRATSLTAVTYGNWEPELYAITVVHVSELQEYAFSAQRIVVVRGVAEGIRGRSCTSSTNCSHLRDGCRFRPWVCASLQYSDNAHRSLSGGIDGGTARYGADGK